MSDSDPGQVLQALIDAKQVKYEHDVDSSRFKIFY
jgi:hypothetical protein